MVCFTIKKTKQKMASPLAIINFNIQIMGGTLLLALLFHIITATSMSIKNQSLRIKLIPVDSLLFPANLTLEEKHQRLFEISRIRALNLKSSIMSSSSPINSTEEDELPMKNSANAIHTSVQRNQAGFYLSQILIGSRQYSPYLIVDSGSDDTWVQCEGCTNCFPIRYGNFKYQQSSSFHTLPCNHPLCVPNICENNRCIYNNRYLRGGSKGWVSTDTFTFSGNTTSTTTDNNAQNMVNVPLVFGCGLDNRDLFEGADNVVGGLLGLASGRRSILLQLADQTKKRFTYCLQPWSTQRGAYTFLYFGDDAKIAGSGSRRVQTTDLLPGIPRYYVKLMGISIEGRLLPINPAVFRLRPNLTGGFAMDSGCPYSLLVESAYGILKAGMVQYFMQRYQWQPLPGQPQGVRFDLCYTKPRGSYSLPSLTFHFDGGANLVLNSDAVFETFGRVFCMAISPTSNVGTSIFGAFQQANYRFLFDVSQNTMSFVPEICQVYRP